MLGAGLRLELQTSNGKLLITEGLYFMYGTDYASPLNRRYALFVVARKDSAYEVQELVQCYDFGTDSASYNLLYEIKTNGVEVWKGSMLPCYIRKLA